MAKTSKKPATKPAGKRRVDEDEEDLFAEEAEEVEETGDDEEEGDVPSSAAGGSKYWQGVFSNLGSGSAGNFVFPKGGKTQVRLLNKHGTPFYIEVPSYFRGKERVKYIFPVWDPTKKDEEGEPDYTIRGLVVPKTAFKAIVAYLAEGYEFFHPLKGHGITLARSGEGRDTAYSVIPSAKPVVLPNGLKTPLAKFTWKAMRAEYNKLRSAKPGGDGDGNGEPSDDGDW